MVGKIETSEQCGSWSECEVEGADKIEVGLSYSGGSLWCSHMSSLQCQAPPAPSHSLLEPLLHSQAPPHLGRPSLCSVSFCLPLPLSRPRQLPFPPLWSFTWHLSTGFLPDVTYSQIPLVRCSSFSQGCHTRLCGLGTVQTVWPKWQIGAESYQYARHWLPRWGTSSQKAWCG